VQGNSEERGWRYSHQLASMHGKGSSTGANCLSLCTTYDKMFYFYATKYIMPVRGNSRAQYIGKDSSKDGERGRMKLLLQNYLREYLQSNLGFERRLKIHLLGCTNSDVINHLLPHAQPHRYDCITIVTVGEGGKQSSRLTQMRSCRRSVPLPRLRH
jgi:hypothetical protein